MSGEKGGVRPSITHRHTETLSATDDDVCAELSWRNEANQSEEISSYISDEDREYIQSTKQAFYFFANIDGAEEGDVINAYNGETLVGSRTWFGEFTDVPAMGKDFQDETQDYCTEGITPRFEMVKPDGKLFELEGNLNPCSEMLIFLTCHL